MKIKDLNKKKVPVVRIDKSLDKFNDIVLFPEKLEKANKMLKSIGLPTQARKHRPHRLKTI